MRYKYVLAAVVLLMLAVLPHFVDVFYQELLSEVLIFGLLALSFDIIFGYTGLLNFGMAIFFGLGGYITLFSIQGLGLGIWSALGMTLAVAVVFSFLYGLICTRFKTHYFVAITLVFSMVFYYVAMSLRPITGADEGLTLMVPDLNVVVAQLNLFDSLNKYYFVLFVTVVVFFFIWRFFNAPMGKAIIAVRENEERALMNGYNAYLLKLAGFTLSGSVACLAGALYVIHLGFISANSFYWLWTARSVWWTIIGGTGTLIGPFLGPGILVFFEDFLSSWNQNFYLIIMGVLMIAMIILAPGGIVGLLRRLKDVLR